MKAINPVNKGRLGPDQPLTTNTVHKKGYVQNREGDKLLITINEFYNGTIWIGIEVDGKFFDLTGITDNIYNELTRLTKPTNE